jgi:hypothetical protein
MPNDARRLVLVLECEELREANGKAAMEAEGWIRE